MATSTIGATGDYTTWQGWVDDNYGVSPGMPDGGEAQGQDEAFDELITVSDGTDVDDITMGSVAGEEQDGVEGTGPRIVRTASGTVLTITANVPVVVNNLEIDINGQTSTSIGISCTTNVAGTRVLNRLLVHGAAGGAPRGIIGTRNDLTVRNCAVYDIASSGGANTSRGIFIQTATRTVLIEQCTFHDINTETTGAAIAVDVADDVDVTVRNCLVGDVGGGGAGSKECYSPASPASAAISYCLSSDATASGTGSLVSKAAANQFTDAVGPAYDFDLKSGADAIDAGTIAGPTTDITGTARSGTYDMGAWEGVSAGGGGTVAGSLALIGVGI